ncbi:type II toxin-antitoxin system RelB/DinJ family antitoxin [Oscillibacter sp.]|uniref:type II toxin-antitoxin system RelB/DinJ family antitoxin n=1 Tax=Oscillibacter sp. TaxID=1945593 RepID=UPI00289A46BA|nr:type II toxin-antitoxin system RelB/DinJ family antitoxin [Oscillibacter sp.]
MATKTANMLARVESEVKERAEAIMAQLGVPASVVINMLYKQIVMTKGIPFSLCVPNVPMARDEMDSATFDALMQRGPDDAKAGRSRLAAEVFAELRRELP